MNIANLVTFSRIFMTPILCFFILNQKTKYASLVSLILFIIAFLTDWLDGFLARRGGASDFGKIFDPVADKVLVFSILLCFIRLDYISIWPVIMLIIRDFLMSSLRILLAKKSVIYSANIWGKIKTVFQFLSISGILLNTYLCKTNFKLLEFSEITIWIAVFVSFVSLTKCIIDNKINLRDLFLG